jgi:uncharacterized membrane protein YkgB
LQLTGVIKVCAQLLLQADNGLIVVSHFLGVQTEYTVTLMALVGVWNQAAHLIGVPENT